MPICLSGGLVVFRPSYRLCVSPLVGGLDYYQGRTYVRAWTVSPLIATVLSITRGGKERESGSSLWDGSVDLVWGENVTAFSRSGRLSRDSHCLDYYQGTDLHAGVCLSLPPCSVYLLTTHYQGTDLHASPSLSPPV